MVEQGHVLRPNRGASDVSWAVATFLRPADSSIRSHLAALSLLFGGLPRLNTVRTQTVEFSDAPGRLSKLGFDEEATIPVESRIPRYTSATWRNEGGSVGTLTHAVALHGSTYDTEVRASPLSFACSF